MSKVRQVVLAIGGLDPSGGAGLLLDAAAIRAAGAYPAAVATALTVQSAVRFEEAQAVRPALVRRSLALVLEDLPVRGVKLGALINAQVVEAVAEALGSSRCPSTVVLDPVLKSTTGRTLLDEAGQRLLKEKLLPLATIVTPNRSELEQLTSRSVHDVESAADAAGVLLSFGCQAVLVKGGHFEGEVAADLLVHRSGFHAFEGPRHKVGEVRGTGCALASAIAAYLVQGIGLEAAVQRAKDLVANGLTNAFSFGRGASVLGLH
ncbi:MAG: bifunctional hydroxymethylpyrimidine kinase/phosphomethylpyrimidine kinase [Myxococcota bacterium]|jgi:hydroxymethylpyrimidine/phosphomethylpyrimidine kinase|nr:bifunctional hydroxymethylpyrimidine kinase/phosphomethylpyrimidine kinase [Myxococcota bacterium]